MAMKSVPATIEDYLNPLPDLVRMRMQQVAHTIMEVCPEAQPTIQYGMPTFIWKGKVLIHYAAYKKHLGIYPVPTSGTDLVDLFKGYKTSGKGTIQFPLAENLPVELLREIIRYRMDLIKSKSNS